MLRYLRRNTSLVVGIVLLGILVVFMVVGALTVDTSNAQPLSVPALQPPSWDYPFGTDRQGRDLLAVMVAGTPLTLRIGFIAGFSGVGVGAVLAFTAAYYGGIVDTVIRSIADIGLTIPGLLVLIIIAVSLKGSLTVEPDGDRRGLAGLAQPDTHHPLPGADAARARLRGDRATERHERTGDHLRRTDAQPAALSGGDAGQQRLRRDPGLDRSGGAGARSG